MSDEGISNPEERIEDILAMMAAGLSLEEALATAGDDAGQLRPLVELAFEVRDLRQEIPIPPPQASLQRMLRHGEAMVVASKRVEPAVPWWQRFLPGFSGWGWPARYSRGLLTMAVVTGLLVIFLGGGLLGSGLVLAAEGSVPGQPLYGLKRFGETIRLSLAGNAAKQQLLEDFGMRRRQEVNHLLRRGDQELVAVTGRIETVVGPDIVFEGLTVQINPETGVDGKLEVGALVQVIGLTQPPDRLVAATVIVLQLPAKPQTPIPTPLSSPTVSPVTSTPTTRPAIESTSDTIKLRPSPTPSPTATASPTPTDTPTSPFVEPLPTAVPQVDGNDNANESSQSESADDSQEDVDNDDPDEDEEANENEDGEEQEEEEEDKGDDNDGDEADNSGHSDDNSGSGSGDNSGRGNEDDSSGSGGDGESGSDGNSGSGSDSDGDGSGSDDGEDSDD
jgi:uncharacterized membrane protein YgcG